MDNDELKTEDVTYVESTEDGDALPVKDITRKLRDDLKQAHVDKEEYLTGWQRAKADYINLQKDMNELRSSSSMLAKEKMAKNLLPVLDSFDMAFANKESWDKVDENWRKGIQYIFSQFMTALSESGIEKIDAIGVPFDPVIHHSIETVPTDDESKDHTVEKVIHAGYKIGERVIRPARVNVFEYKN